MNIEKQNEMFDPSIQHSRKLSMVTPVTRTSELRIGKNSSLPKQMQQLLFK